MSLLTVGILMLHAVAAAPADDVVAQFDERTFALAGADPPREIRYRLLKPAAIEPGKRYPVLLFLHGAGERGDDNRSQLQYLPEWMTRGEWREKYPCYLVAPQCPKDQWWTGRTRSGEDPDKNAAKTARPAEAELALTALLALAADLPIDQKRIYLSGLSMGGYGSWALAAAHPELFAAVVPICGGGDKAWAEQLKNVPIWAVHGGADKVVPAEKSREMIAAIKAVGGNPQYTELEGVGHNSWTPAYNDPHGVLEWMFQQHK
jgi:predicted peptidase